MQRQPGVAEGVGHGLLDFVGCGQGRQFNLTPAEENSVVVEHRLQPAFNRRILGPGGVGALVFVEVPADPVPVELVGGQSLQFRLQGVFLRLPGCRFAGSLFSGEAQAQFVELVINLVHMIGRDVHQVIAHVGGVVMSSRRICCGELFRQGGDQSLFRLARGDPLTELGLDKALRILQQPVKETGTSMTPGLAVEEGDDHVAPHRVFLQRPRVLEQHGGIGGGPRSSREGRDLAETVQRCGQNQGLRTARLVEHRIRAGDHGDDVAARARLPGDRTAKRNGFTNGQVRRWPVVVDPDKIGWGLGTEGMFAARLPAIAGEDHGLGAQLKGAAPVVTAGVIHQYQRPRRELVGVRIEVTRPHV